MKLIVGLGNVGNQYARSRHNLGFMAVDRLATDLGATWKTALKLHAEVAIADLPAGERAVLAKPHTMMNLSGQAVQRLMQQYKVVPADVWALFDDVDIPFGRMRLRAGGSAGGHQGTASIIRHIGSDFIRARLGISLNDRTLEPSETYVLKPFNATEQAMLPALLEKAAQILLTQIQADGPDETTFTLLA